MIPLIDTHAHLDFPDFVQDLPAVLAHAQAAGVTQVVSIGTDLASSRRGLDIANRFPGIRAVVGWHPGHAEEAPDDIRAELRALARHPMAAAIGECGLDFYRLPTRTGQGTAEDDERIRSRQLSLFVQHLEVAAETGLNVVVHTRDSFEATVDCFTPYAGRVRAVFHCFVGTAAEMERVIALGSLVSFTGIVTFKNSAVVRETLAATPFDRFMLETDCPYLAPVPHRGHRCEPAFVREIADTAAQITGRTADDIAEITGRTARGFFRGLGRT